MTKKKSNYPTAVGDVVTMNKEGFDLVGMPPSDKIGKLTWTITEFGTHSDSFPEPSYDVKVDDPELNQLVLFHWAFDKVSRKGGEENV